MCIQSGVLVLEVGAHNYNDGQTTLPPPPPRLAGDYCAQTIRVSVVASLWLHFLLIILLFFHLPNRVITITLESGVQY